MGMINRLPPLKRAARATATLALATLALAGLTAVPLLHAARADETEASRAARWHDVANAIFHGRQVGDGSAVLQLDAPPRALDAALVPVTVTVQQSVKPKTITLIVDDNPAPVAGVVHFGPLADPHLLKLRVRVDQYTLMHAVAEMPDGTLLGVSRYVKAAGGCSAPGSARDPAALARLGRMKLFVTPGANAGQPQTAQLLISHPNANGMQMDPVSRLYTPARYVQTISISQAGKQVLSMDADISLSEDPAITFSYLPVGTAALDVEVDDSAKSVFRQSFPAGQHAS